MFSEDGVHLTDDGYVQICCSVRVAVEKAVATVFCTVPSSRGHPVTDDRMPTKDDISVICTMFLWVAWLIWC